MNIHMYHVFTEVVRKGCIQREQSSKLIIHNSCS